jgi:beta-galactosidase
MCKDTHLTLNTRAKGPLYIILEELGRLNFGRGNDFKGILTPVKGDGKILSNWTECGVNVNKLPTLISNLLEYEPDPFASENDLPNPGIFLSSFNIKLPDDIGAFTYFDGSNLGKGQFFLNGYNVGRYWPSAGPEISIYVPGVFFKNNTLNQIALINFESAAPSKTLNFVTDLTWKN